MAHSKIMSTTAAKNPVKQKVIKKRMVEETVEDEFGFPVTKMREETYEVEEETAIELQESTEASNEVAPAPVKDSPTGTQKDGKIQDGKNLQKLPSDNLASPEPESSSFISASGSVEDSVKVQEIPGESNDSDEASKNSEEPDESEPKRDKAAGFRALLEKEQRAIRKRNKAKGKVAGIFEEEASEEEDEAQDGIGEYGDQVSKHLPHASKYHST